MTSWSQLDNRNLDPGGGQEVRPWQVGDVIMCYGVLATLLADRPGFALMDGTVTLPGGVTPPSMVDSVPIGAGNLYALGATGGSAAQTNHVVTQPNQHTNAGTGHIHTLVSGAVLQTSGTPNVSSQTDSQGLHTHDAHTGVTVNAHGTNLPPYAALYFLIYTGNV